MGAGEYRIRFIAVLLALLLLVAAVQAVDRVVLDCCSRGDELTGKGNFTGALEAYVSALNREGEYAPAWYGKGVALSRLGRYAEANDAFDQALLRDMNYVAAWNGKGVALQNLGRCREALNAYNYALALDPENAYAEANRQLVIARLAAAPATTTPRQAPQQGSPKGWFGIQGSAPSAGSAGATKTVSAAPTKGMLYPKDVGPSQYAPAQGSVGAPGSIPAVSGSGTAVSGSVVAPPSVPDISTMDAPSSAEFSSSLNALSSKGINIGKDEQAAHFMEVVDLAKSQSDQSGNNGTGFEDDVSPLDANAEKPSLLSFLSPLLNLIG